MFTVCKSAGAYSFDLMCSLLANNYLLSGSDFFFWIVGCFGIDFIGPASIC